MRYVLAALLTMGMAVSGQEMLPGTARPLIDPNAPAATTGYICPMHPN